ncbi:MAG: S24 family peptidase [Anaerolineales bacterium]|nr:S24 family peptidase [Anaerolineales bacterium]
MADKVRIIQNLNSYEFIRTNWLHQFKEATKQGDVTWRSYLNWSEQSDVEELRRLVQAGKTAEAWKHYDRLSLKMLEEGNDLKIGDVTIHLVEAELNLGRLSKANKLINSAVLRFARDPHNLAVVMWLSGIVCWRQEDGSCWDAMHHWEACRKEFERLHATGPFGETRSEWYRQRLDEIRLFLDEKRQELSSGKAASVGATPSVGIPAVGAAATAAASAVASNPVVGTTQDDASPKSTDGVRSPINKPKVTHPKPNEGYLRIFPIRRAATSAGQLKANYVGDAGYIDVERVVIENVSYQIHPLVDSDRMVNMLDFRRVYALRVHGDSMNTPGPEAIEDGDLVLVLPVDFDPFHEKSFPGRIVITSTNEPGSEETNIKKLVYDGKQIRLEFQSQNPKHEPFINFQKGWKIMGVVLARLTPVDEQEDSPE